MSENNETLGGPAGDNGLQKDPDEWVSGDDPMTESQRSYLDTLARQAGEELPADLTKAEASKHIDRLRAGGTTQEAAGQASGPGSDEPPADASGTPDRP
jgi:hypothetical protein